MANGALLVIVGIGGCSSTQMALYFIAYAMNLALGLYAPTPGAVCWSGSAGKQPSSRSGCKGFADQVGLDRGVGSAHRRQKPCLEGLVVELDDVYSDKIAWVMLNTSAGVIPLVGAISHLVSIHQGERALS
ncbi:hypothetical protein BJY01DRAFT_255471 [Aspergillus pseudoustus]|uniref:Uncharacterized protein n=1 Tax=Aspergillus pseudoustus TaxID=1810923 RepID=A0ABR4IK27_9EURO